MAEFRHVHCKTWRDDWFSELDTDSKLLWLYLITNQATSVSGIYQLPRKFIAFETGLSVKRIDEIMKHFKSAGKIDYDDSVIWICKMREYQAGNSPKVATRITLDFDSVPNCRVKGIYAQKYGIDTVSIPTQESVSDTDTDTDTETEGETNSAYKPRTPQKEKATCPADWMTVLYGLTKIDQSTATKEARKNLSDCGKALIAGGATIDQLATFERNWYALDWRGKQGQAPTVKQVRDEWGKYSKPLNGNGNGHAPQPVPIAPDREAALARAFR